jgi:hypothetical protein
LNIKQAISNIESHELAVRVNIASDLKTFFKLAQQEEVVLWLGRQLDVYEIRLEILSRIYELSKYKIDLRYENQWDTALAVYLWLLNNRDPIIAKIAAEVTSQIPQCWWAVKLSRFILFQKELYSDTKDNITSKVISPPLSINLKHDAGEVQVCASLFSAIDKIYPHKYDFIIEAKNPNDSVSNESSYRREDHVVGQLNSKTNISEKVCQL